MEGGASEGQVGGEGRKEGGMAKSLNVSDGKQSHVPLTGVDRD